MCSKMKVNTKNQSHNYVVKHIDIDLDKKPCRRSTCTSPAQTSFMLRNESMIMAMPSYRTVDGPAHPAVKQFPTTKGN